jgi:CubicO group peptidase (beta-lactamase class C family)
VPKNRTPTWLALIVGAIGLPLAAIVGLWGYKSVTAPILHPDPQQVRSVTHSDPSRKWTDAVQRGRQIVRAGLTQQNLPGLSVAVGVEGVIVWAEGFGYADLENQATVTPETRFRVADASKALTSAAVGLLLEKNMLHLDDEIQVHVPEFPKKQWPVTLRQVMAQVAGVRTDPNGDAPLSNTHSDDGNPARRCERTVDGLQLESFAERELLFEPGTRYRPSSYGWILVSAAVEAAANEPFFAFMRTEVFEPRSIVRVYHANPSNGIDRGTVSGPDFLDWQRTSQAAETMGAFFHVDGLTGVDLTGVGNPERLSSTLVTDGFFQTLGSRPLPGRTLLGDDHVPGRDRVVEISHGLWVRRFGADPSIAGRSTWGSLRLS